MWRCWQAGSSSARCCRCASSSGNERPPPPRQPLPYPVPASVGEHLCVACQRWVWVPLASLSLRQAWGGQTRRCGRCVPGGVSRASACACENASSLFAVALCSMSLALACMEGSPPLVVQLLHTIHNRGIRSTEHMQRFLAGEWHQSEPALPALDRAVARLRLARE